MPFFLSSRDLSRFLGLEEDGRVYSSGRRDTRVDESNWPEAAFFPGKNGQQQLTACQTSGSISALPTVEDNLAKI